ncbi:MAG: hypothetical protein HY279_10950, partial [Nitrospinae bacterium]|nr:hypothetical protein [Nitrospinota bacterium]
MARQLRIEFEGAFYHITSRGNLRDRVIFEDKDRDKFYCWFKLQGKKQARRIKYGC